MLKSNEAIRVVSGRKCVPIGHVTTDSLVNRRETVGSLKELFFGGVPMKDRIVCAVCSVSGAVSRTSRLPFCFLLHVIP